MQEPIMIIYEDDDEDAAIAEGFGSKGKKRINTNKSF